MKKFKALFNNNARFFSLGYKLLLLVITIALTSAIYTVIAAPPTTKYSPGDTLTPNCSPGDTNCSVTSPITGNETITLSSDVSGSGTTTIAVTIAANAVEESMLKAVDTASDEECLTYETTTGDFEWQTCSSATGDITDVGDCSSGACYDGSSDGGTYLRLYDGDSHYTSLASGNVSGNVAIVLPTTAGTLLLTTGNAATATALFADPSDCSANQYATGIATSGNLTCASIGAGDFTAASIDGDDLNSNLAGRSLVLTAGSPDTLDADAELYTDTKCYRLSNTTGIADTKDDKSIWYAKQATTITSLWCESDQTVTAMLQVDDGSVADVDSVDLTCDATPPEDTSLDGDATLASGDRLDLDIFSVASTPTWFTICWTMTYDD